MAGNEELTESKIRQIKECVGFFGVENAALMYTLPAETINRIVGQSTEKTTEKTTDDNPPSGQASRPSSKSSRTEKAADERFERSENKGRISSHSSRGEGSSANKRKLKDCEDGGSSRRSPSPSRGSYKRLRSGGSKASVPHYADVRASDSDDAGEEGEYDEVPPSDDHSEDGRWVSSYISGAADAAKYRGDGKGGLANNYLFNSFKTLLKAKKMFIDTEHVVSIFICNLMSSTQDIFLYPNHSKFMVQPGSAKNCLNTSMCLAITSTGCKFKPAFLLSHLDVLGRSLASKRQLVHVKNRCEWLESVFKPEMEMNMIYNAICLTENEDLYQDKTTRELFGELNCELIVVPNSLALHISPFQHSVLLALNGILHDLYLTSNNKFPSSLAESLTFFEKAWDRLSEAEIRNAFDSTVMKAFLAEPN